MLGAGAVTSALLLTDVWPAIRGPDEWHWGRRILHSPAPLLLSVLLFVATVWVASRVRSVRGSFAVVPLIFAQMLTLTAAEPGGLSNLRRRVLDRAFTS
jgi:hypothetical protein